jgi:hypothetical protein
MVAIDGAFNAIHKIGSNSVWRLVAQILHITLTKFCFDGMTQTPSKALAVRVSALRRFGASRGKWVLFIFFSVPSRSQHQLNARRPT